MTAEFAPYLKYKDSGLSWFGNIPLHWKAMKLRNITLLIVSNVDKITKEMEIPVRLCNYIDVYKNDRITANLPFMVATAQKDEIAHFGLHLDDVIITKDSESWRDIGVPSLVEYTSHDLICGYHLAILRPCKEIALGSYLYHALKSAGVATQFHVGANGVTRYGLSQSDIKNVWIPVPPLEEQTAIVRFLDHIDRRVKRYIRAKQKQIKLLNEQKQAIIQQAVTRGLDPTVRLKPSGVEWLGEVPQHWEVLRSRYLFQEVDVRSITGQEVHLSMSQRLGLVPHNLMEERRLIADSYIGGKICQIDDLVLNRLKAHLGVFALAKVPGVVSPDYTIFRKRRDVSMRYFEMVLRSPGCRVEFIKRAKGIVQGFWRLYTDDFYDIRLPVPPLDEQLSIIDSLNKDGEAIDSAIIKYKREIVLVKDYQLRLISDVVTGKVDVRKTMCNLTPEIEKFDLIEAVKEIVDDELINEVVIEGENENEN